MGRVEDIVQFISCSKNKTFLVACVAFLSGVAMASFASTRAHVSVLTQLVIVSSAILFGIWKIPSYRLCGVVGLFFLLGLLRSVSFIPPTTSDQLSFYNGQVMEIKGYVVEEPDRRLGTTYYTIAAESVGLPLEEKKVIGRVLMNAPRYPEFFYGQQVRLKGLIMAPENKHNDTFRYDKYLAGHQVWSIMNRGSIFAVAHSEKWLPLKPLVSFKSFVRNQLEGLWPEPESSFMAGLLYGDKSGLPPALLVDFSRTGVTHIIAVSGFNVSIIVIALLPILIYIGFSRRQVFWILISAIVFLMLFTGASASVVRAGIMGLTVLCAERLGRLSRIGTTLVITATIMALINPYVLIWDVGFQLSFLATLGLVYITPIFKKIFQKIHFLNSEVFLSTISAIVATVPLILFQFGVFSLVALGVNILILWIIPWLMLGGATALLASFVYFPLGQVVAWITGVGLRYVILIVTFFGEKSWAALPFSLPWWGMMLLYVGMVWGVVYFQKYYQHEYGQHKNKNV